MKKVIAALLVAAFAVVAPVQAAPSEEPTVVINGWFGGADDF